MIWFMFPVSKNLPWRVLRFVSIAGNFSGSSHFNSEILNISSVQTEQVRRRFISQFGGFCLSESSLVYFSLYWRDFKGHPGLEV